VVAGCKPSKSNINSLNNVRCEASRHFRSTKKEYLKQKLIYLKLTVRLKKKVRDLYRSISDFKKGYQPRTNIVQDDKGDVVTGSHSIFTRWRNCISQLFKVHGVSDVRQTEIHTAEPLVPEPRFL